MEVHNQQNPHLYHEEEDDDGSYSESGGSDSDSDWDIEETQGRLSNLSIKKKSISRRDPEKVEINVEDVDEKGIDEVQKIIEGGKIEKLKIEQCKVYLRKNGLRLTGNKETLILRIKEHQEILNGGGEKKYPVSSFVLNCKGDACTGDVVMFEQNVYETYSIVSRSAMGPPCGTRIVVGRIVKESYGAAKQQHTFTIEVLWSKGEKPLPPLHPLLIKGRNLYRLKTLRQKWEDEGERQKALMDKHSRGSLARCARESRIQDKQMRKTLREKKSLKKDGNKNKPQLKSSTSNSNQGIQTQQHLCSSVDLRKAAPDFQLSAILMQNSGSYINIAKQPAEAQKAPRHPPVNKNPCTTGENGYPGQRLTSMNNFHPIISLPGTNVANEFSERYHRQPFASMNNCHPVIPQNRQSCNKQQQQCKFYAQGRCFYGDRCKFLHDGGKNFAAK